MSAARWPIEVLPAGPIAVGARVWRYRAALRVSVIAKATFALVPGGEARPSEPLEVIRDEVYASGNPAMPLLAASDLAPWIERAEVLFTGHAWAPGGAPVRHMLARLAILRDGTALVDKRLGIVGDRQASAAWPSPEPEPFVKMPVVYQRSWGGAGRPENPFGVGAVRDAAGRITLPNVLPADGRRAPAGFGPIAPILPERALLLRGLPHAQLEGIAAIPDDVDWSYFQAAPSDQRFDRVLGGEWLVLEGLHRRCPALATRLPALRALAAIYLPSGEVRPLALGGDTLIVEGDAERCAVVFRGSFQLDDGAVLPLLRVVAGIEIAGRPIAWPAPAELAARAPREDEPTQRLQKIDWSTTLTLDDAEVVEVSERAPREERTTTLSAQELQRLDSEAAMSAPFPIAPAGGRDRRGGWDMPGAPWSPIPAPSVPISSPLEATIDLSAPQGPPRESAPMPAPTSGSSTAALAEPPHRSEPAPTLTSAPAPQPEPPRAPESEPWAKSEPAPITKPEAPRPPSSKPDLTGSLYKRFRKG